MTIPFCSPLPSVYTSLLSLLFLRHLRTQNKKTRTLRMKRKVLRFHSPAPAALVFADIRKMVHPCPQLHHRVCTSWPTKRCGVYISVTGAACAASWSAKKKTQSLLSIDHHLINLERSWHFQIAVVFFCSVYLHRNPWRSVPNFTDQARRRTVACGGHQRRRT